MNQIKQEHLWYQKNTLNDYMPVYGIPQQDKNNIYDRQEKPNAPPTEIEKDIPPGVPTKQPPIKSPHKLPGKDNLGGIKRELRWIDNVYISYTSEVSGVCV